MDYLRKKFSNYWDDDTLQNILDSNYGDLPLTEQYLISVIEDLKSPRSDEIDNDLELAQAKELSLSTGSSNLISTATNAEQVFDQELEYVKDLSLANAKRSKEEYDNDALELSRAIKSSLADARLEKKLNLELKNVKKLSKSQTSQHDSSAFPTTSMMDSIVGPLGRHRHRTYIPVHSNDVGSIVGKGFIITNAIQKSVGGNCSITVPPKTKINGEITAIVIEADSKESLDKADAKIFERIYSHTNVSSSPITTGSTTRSSGMLIRGLNQLCDSSKRHVFVDNSNIFYGAQQRINNDGNIEFDKSVRINATKLANLLTQGNTDGKRIVAGSTPPFNSSVWAYWEAANFRLKLIQRNSQNKEEAVDEFLHAQAFETILHHKCDPPGENTIVIATGDGGTNDGYSTFERVAEFAAREGFRVEVWSWRLCMSQKYKDLASRYADTRVTLHYLDDHPKTKFFKKIIPLPPTVDESNMKVGPTSSSATSSNSLTSIEAETKEEDEVVTEEEKNDSQDITCIICMVNDRTHVIFPCRHGCYCLTCLYDINVCAVCNGPKTYVHTLSDLNVYYT